VGAGFKADVNLLALMGTRGRIHGSTLRPRPVEEKAAVARRMERHVLPQLASGKLTVPLLATFPFSQVEDAYARFDAGGKLGKIVLLAG
jgi:NADPH:quinone reductase-like Zn-dependent oxidoreductase